MLRDNLVELIEPMLSGAGPHPLAPRTNRKHSSDDRPACLENPRPAGAESTLTENVASPFHAEPGHANLFHQRLIGRFRFVAHTLQCLTESTATHPQSEGLLQHGCRLAVGQSQTFIELRGQGQRSGAQLRSSTADRIRGLPGMPALHPPSATPATSHMNAKLNALHSWFRNLGLILGYDAPFLHSPSAMRTLRRQGYVDDLIDTLGNRPTTSPPVLASCFASRLLRVRLGTPPREGGRLTLGRSQRLFQQTSQSLVLFLQLFNLAL